MNGEQAAICGRIEVQVNFEVSLSAVEIKASGCGVGDGTGRPGDDAVVVERDVAGSQTFDDIFGKLEIDVCILQQQELEAELGALSDGGDCGQAVLQDAAAA
ncbi:MAG: hypothetical protein ACKPHU_26605, partial [Planctomycetaceae bacterium]